MNTIKLELESDLAVVREASREAALRYAEVIAKTEPRRAAHIKTMVNEAKLMDHAKSIIYYIIAESMKEDPEPLSRRQALDIACKLSEIPREIFLRAINRLRAEGKIYYDTDDHLRPIPELYTGDN